MKKSNHSPIPFSRKALILVSLLVVSAQIYAQPNAAQPPVFQAQKIEQTTANPALNQTFTAFAVYQVDVNALGEYFHAPHDSARALTIRFGEEHDWNLLLEPVDMVLPGATITIASEDGEQQMPLPLIRAFKGVIADDPGNSEVRLTVNDDFVYGFVRQGEQSYFIEPLRYHVQGAGADLFVLYDAADVLPGVVGRCGNTEVAEQTSVSQSEQTPCSGCKIAGIGIASDYSMFEKYGSIAGVANHVVGVLNNVNSLYDNEFSCEIRFVINKLFFSTCPGCDPWSGTTNSSELLDEFKDWGNNLGFCILTSSVSGLWTNRMFEGSTIGRAFRPGFCNNNAYHVLRDYTSTSSLLRTLQAHEIGHNLDCEHDYEFDNSSCNPPGRAALIMDPAVSTSTTWSNGSQICALNSVSTINNYFNDLDCISDCSSSLLAEAWVDFDNQNCFQLGSFDYPFNLLQFAVNRIQPGGTITIKSSSGPETITITKACTITSVDGSSTIGEQ